MRGRVSLNGLKHLRGPLAAGGHRRHGHQGVVRFGAFGIEAVGGQLGFGENSLCSTSMDSPGGMQGLSPAAPVLGSTTRKLRRGDLVLFDRNNGIQQ